MIIELRSKEESKADFGFGQTSKTISQNEEIEINITSIISEDYQLLVFIIDSSDAIIDSGFTLTIIDDFNFKIEFDKIGTYKIASQFQNRRYNILANELEIIVI